MEVKVNSNPLLFDFNPYDWLSLWMYALSLDVKEDGNSNSKFQRQKIYQIYFPEKCKNAIINILLTAERQKDVNLFAQMNDLPVK